MPSSLKNASKRFPSGKRIQVFWPLDRSWYSATVLQSVPLRKKQVVLYGDGDVEELDLLQQERQGLIRMAPDAYDCLRQNLEDVKSGLMGQEVGKLEAQEEWRFCYRQEPTANNCLFKVVAETDSNLNDLAFTAVLVLDFF